MFSFAANYPYEFATSVQQLRMCTELPPKEAFYSKVSNSGISDKDYEETQEIFKVFQLKSMLDFTELYCQVINNVAPDAALQLRLHCLHLQLDVILLASCFISFRNEVLQEFGLGNRQTAHTHYIYSLNPFIFRLHKLHKSSSAKF